MPDHRVTRNQQDRRRKVMPHTEMLERRAAGERRKPIPTVLRLLGA